jgi:hypothetical protein
VICIALKNAATGESASSSSWLRLDGEYAVIGLLAVPGRSVELQVIGESRQPPTWWPSDMFMTSDAALPSTWVAQVGDGGVLRMGPAPLLAEGFWERYFDRDPEATRAFDEELSRMDDELGPRTAD